MSQDAAVDGVAVTLAEPITNEHHLVYVSPSLASLLGYRAEQLLGRSLITLFGTHMAARELESIDAQLQIHSTVETSHLLRSGSGEAVAVHATHTVLPALAPTAGARLILFRDLSKRSAEQLLSDQAFVLESLERGQDLGALCHQVAVQIEDRLGSAGHCWIGVTDPQNRLEPVVTSGGDPEIVAHTLRLVMGSGEPTTARCVLVENLPTGLAQSFEIDGIVALWAFPTLDSKRQQCGALVVAHRGHEVPTDDEVRLLDNLAGVVGAGIERAAAEAVLAHRALHDPLTRLPNRALLVDRLEHTVARLERDPASLSVLLVDIDRFKSLNDSRGPDVGDRVLLEVAGRLLASVRLGDTVGRISSDQFLMICSANVGFDPSIVARRAIRSVQEPITLDSGEELRITASVGVVAVDGPGMSPTAIIGKAESALGSAVENGRGRFVVFEEGQQKAAAARHDIEQALHAAIVKNELVLHYQPVCEIKTGRIIGAEALVRWDRPGHGLLGPADFIDIAEDTGLILPLGAWVIEEVGKALASWPKSSGLSPVVTVNLSARQLADDSLVPLVLEVLERNSLPPVRMGFEVTESMRVDDYEAAVVALTALSELGCRIAVDDFGIGYATLDYLRRFSMADVIKIDRSFVAGLGRSKEDSAIVNASMALATSLQKRVVAEGVETAGQLEILAAIGCHYAQGYALSAPVPLETVLQLWAGGKLFDPPTTDRRSEIAVAPVT